MKDSGNLEMKVFDSIPDHLIGRVDQLLEDNKSNNRISDQRSLNDYSKESFDNRKDRFKYIITISDQKVVGIIILFKRKIQFNGKDTLLGGLGGVGTRKEYRGKGIASEMLKLARKILYESNCDIAYLGTDINDPVMLKIYGRIGFVPLKRTHTYLGRSGQRHLANNGMIAPINSQEKFNEILQDNEPFNIGYSNW